MIGLLMAWAVVGTEGIPIPYSPRMDDGITVVLLCCFFLSAYVLSRSRKFLLQLVKDFLLHRERTSIFATSTAADIAICCCSSCRLASLRVSVSSATSMIYSRNWYVMCRRGFCWGFTSVCVSSICA